MNVKNADIERDDSAPGLRLYAVAVVAALCVWGASWTLGRYVLPRTIERGVLLQKVQAPMALPEELYEGNPDAAVTLVEVADFECSHCAAFQQALHKLKDRYGADLRLGFLPYARGRMSHKYLYGAAILAAARQGKGAAMKQAVFAADLSPRAIGPDRLGYARRVVTHAAEKLALDMASFEQVLDSPKTARLLRELGERARVNGLRGTPTVFVNGYRIHAGPRHAVCQAVIEAFLAQKS